ncbi:MAG TPA: hypothetical protein VLK29_04050, partial [Luteimonas sp.]|nr:hypothetical protein [Luteimonas sp.]
MSTPPQQQPPPPLRRRTRSAARRIPWLAVSGLVVGVLLFLLLWAGQRTDRSSAIDAGPGAAQPALTPLPTPATSGSRRNERGAMPPAAPASTGSPADDTRPIPPPPPIAAEPLPAGTAAGAPPSEAPADAGRSSDPVPVTMPAP